VKATCLLCSVWVVCAGCAAAPRALVYDAWHHHPHSAGHGGGWYLLTDKGPRGYSEAARILMDDFELFVRDEPFRLDDLPPRSAYWIVNPDNLVHTTSPNYITDHEIDQLEAFVGGGGTLILFANDPVNCEREHLNRLAERFGLRFNADETDDEAIAVTRHGVVFPKPLVLQYMWGCTIRVADKVAVAFSVDNDPGRMPHGNIMVGVLHGQGKVLAVGDAGSWTNASIGRRDTSDVFGRIMRWARP